MPDATVECCYHVGDELNRKRFSPRAYVAAPDALKEELRRGSLEAPGVDFDNGFYTAVRPAHAIFRNALGKFREAAPCSPVRGTYRSPPADISYNSGYNSIQTTLKYQFSVRASTLFHATSMAARFLAALAEYRVSSNWLARRGSHVPGSSMLGSLSRSFDNLKMGGYIELETQVFGHPQSPNICYFIHRLNSDQTNFWALSTPVLEEESGIDWIR